MAKNIPTLGLAIDWETSGYSLPDYASKHQGISIGAAVFNLKTFEPIETYYQVIKFNKTHMIRIYMKVAIQNVEL